MCDIDYEYENWRSNNENMFGPTMTSLLVTTLYIP